MSDPRIQRTRIHVLETARAMLAQRSGEQLTFTSLANAAQVSRRTLYTHWGTIEKVISEAVVSRGGDEIGDLSHLAPRERLAHVLEATRASINDPVIGVALASLMNQATHDDEVGDSLTALLSVRMEQFRAAVAPITPDQYTQLVGPIFMSVLLLRRPVSDAFLAELVECGMELLNLGD